VKLTHDEAWEMAKALTEELWRIGAEADHEVYRIAFRGATRCGGERDMGGLGKQPMIDFLASRMIEYSEKANKKPHVRAARHMEAMVGNYDLIHSTGSERKAS